MFLALKGEKFDGHDYLSRAVSDGAAAVIVSHASRLGTLGVPVFEVRDTLVALGALGNFRRRAWGRPVIGVAGSNGKTSTKDLILAALASAHAVHATTGNLNNRVGVPLTLLAIPDSAEIAVIELGTSLPGEVEILRNIAEPDISVVTSIAEEHLEGLGDLGGVLREECMAFDGVETAVVPAAQPEIAREARLKAGRVVVAGLEIGFDLSADSWSIGGDGLGEIVIGDVSIRPPLRGEHNLRNAMLALAIARECGVSLESAARGIAAMPQPKMRAAWEELGKMTIINDAYNANPGSTRAAIEMLQAAGREAAGRQRVIVLGTMRELGAGSERLHDEIADLAVASGADLVAGIGDFAPALEKQKSPVVITATDVTDLWPQLQPRLKEDAIILLKASRGVELERLLPFLSEWTNQTSGAKQRP